MSAFNVIQSIDAIKDKLLKLPLNKMKINRKILVYTIVEEIMQFCYYYSTLYKVEISLSAMEFPICLGHINHDQADSS
jgi:hypothetical protein